MEHTKKKTDSSPDGYRAAAKAIPHFYFECDSSGKILFINPKGMEISGYTARDIKNGLFLREIVTSEYREQADRDFQRMLSGEQLLGVEYHFTCKDGTPFPAFICPHPIVNGKDITGVGCVILETQLQERLENLLRRQKRRTDDYFELSTTLLLRRDRDANILELNKTGCSILECTEEEAVGKNWIETFVLPEDRPAVRKYFYDMINGNIEPYRHRPARRIVTKNGNVKLMNWKNRLMKTQFGEIVGVVSAGEDVTERIYLERELKESELKYRSIFNESRDGKVLIDAETGQIVESNLEFQRQTGRSPDELSLMKIWELRPDRLAAAAKEKFREIQQTGDTDIVRTEYEKPDGTITPVEFTTRELVLGGVRYFQSISRDISSRIEAETMLRQSEAQYRNLYAMMLEGVIYVDREGRILSMNPSAERILGFTNKEVPTYKELLSRYHPVREDGTAYTGDQFPSSIVFQTGEPVSNTVIGLQQPGSSEYRWFLGSCVPEFHQGETTPFRIFLTFTEITEARRIARNLQQSEEKFSRIFQELTDAIIIIDINTNIILEANDSAIAMSGYERHELIGNNINNFNFWAHKEDQKRIKAKILETGGVQDEEYEFRRKNGEIMTVLLSTKRMVLNDTLCGVSIQTDITERKRAEKALRESEEKFAKIFNSSPDAIVVTNLTTSLMTDVNESMLAISGYQRDEIIGHSAIEISLWKNPEDRTRIVSLLQQDGSIDNEELKFRMKDGKIRTFLYSARIIEQAGEESMISVLLDITERMQAEQALRESEAKFSRIFHANPHPMAILGEGGCYVDINDAHIKLLGYTREDIEGKTPDDLNLWVSNEEYDRFRRIISNRLPVNDEEVRFRTKSGDVRTMLFSLEDITMAGQPKHVSVLTDITDRIEAEQALRESEAKFSTVFQSSPDSIVIVGPDKNYVDVNGAFLDISGYTREEVIGHSAGELGVWADPKNLKEMIGVLESTGRVDKWEVLYRHKDGRITNGLFSAQAMTFGDQRFVVGISKDITERVEAERALRESEAKFSRIFHANPHPMAIMTEGGYYVELNKAFTNVLGYTTKDVAGKTPPEIGLWADVEELKSFREKFNAGIPITAEELRFCTKSGDIRTMLLSLEAIILGGKRSYISVCTDITERKKIEKELAEEAARRRILMEQSQDGIVILDQDGAVYEANRSFADMLGYSTEEMQQLHVWDWDAQIPRQRLRSMLLEIDERGDHFETVHRRKDGSLLNVDITTNGAMFGDRNLVFCIVRDITERKQVEQALRESEEKFAVAFHSSPDPIMITSADNTYIDVNDAYVRLYGHPREERIGNTLDLSGFVYEEQKEHIQKIFREKGRVADYECQIRSRHGKVLTVLLSRQPIILAGKQCYLGITHDITERKKAEQALRDSEQKFSTAFMLSPDSILIVRMRDLVILDVNDQATRFSGFSREELIGTPYSEIGPLVTDDDLDEIVGSLTQRGEISHQMFEFHLKNGEARIILLAAKLFDFEGEACILIVVTDITEQQAMSQALRESEEKFATAFHTSPDPIAITDTDGHYIDVNEAFVRTAGYTREELLAVDETGLHLLVHREQLEEITIRLIEEGSIHDYECQVKYRDGAIHTILLSIVPITLAGKECHLTISHDITERKQAEEALRESEKRFSTAFHSNPQLAIITSTKDGSYYEVNDNFCKTTGYTREELINHTGTESNLWVDQDEFAKFLNELSSNSSARGEYRFRMKNGDIRTWLCSADFITLRGEKCMLATASDITERIRAEEEIKKLYSHEASLRQQLEEEMKRRAEFTRALVHELKTPLTPIVASSDTLTDILTEEPMKSMAANVNRGALNLNKRIDELLELARSELNILQISPTDLDIDLLMNEIISEMEPMASKNQHELKLEIPEPLPVIQADPERIRQVISNLLTNAMKFSQRGGEIKLRGTADMENITVQVKDTGPGLTKAELDRLFQPYYRKESDREHLSGLGLGLALCKTLVDLHGGKIWAESKPGEGSTFTFTLPIQPSFRKGLHINTDS